MALPCLQSKAHLLTRLKSIHHHASHLLLQPCLLPFSKLKLCSETPNPLLSPCAIYKIFNVQFPFLILFSSSLTTQLAYSNWYLTHHSSLDLNIIASRPGPPKSRLGGPVNCSDSGPLSILYCHSCLLCLYLQTL